MFASLPINISGEVWLADQQDMPLKLERIKADFIPNESLINWKSAL